MPRDLDQSGEGDEHDGGLDSFARSVNNDVGGRDAERSANNLADLPRPRPPVFLGETARPYRLPPTTTLLPEHVLKKVERAVSDPLLEMARDVKLLHYDEMMEWAAEWVAAQPIPRTVDEWAARMSKWASERIAKNTAAVAAKAQAREDQLAEVEAAEAAANGEPVEALA